MLVVKKRVALTSFFPLLVLQFPPHFLLSFLFLLPLFFLSLFFFPLLFLFLLHPLDLFLPPSDLLSGGLLITVSYDLPSVYEAELEFIRKLSRCKHRH